MQDSSLGLKMVASSLARHIHRIQWMVGFMGGAQERAYEDSDYCLFAPDSGNLRNTSLSHIKDGSWPNSGMSCSLGLQVLKSMGWDRTAAFGVSLYHSSKCGVINWRLITREGWGKKHLR